MEIREEKKTVGFMASVLIETVACAREGYSIERADSFDQPSIYPHCSHFGCSVSGSQIHIAFTVNSHNRKHILVDRKNMFSVQSVLLLYVIQMS